MATTQRTAPSIQTIATPTLVLPPNSQRQQINQCRQPITRRSNGRVGSYIAVRSEENGSATRMTGRAHHGRLGSHAPYKGGAYMPDATRTVSADPGGLRHLVIRTREH